MGYNSIIIIDVVVKLYDDGRCTWCTINYGNGMNVYDSVIYIIWRRYYMLSAKYWLLNKWIALFPDSSDMVIANLTVFSKISPFICYLVWKYLNSARSI